MEQLLCSWLQLPLSSVAAKDGFVLLEIQVGEQAGIIAFVEAVMLLQETGGHSGGISLADAESSHMQEWWLSSSKCQ